VSLSLPVRHAREKNQKIARAIFLEKKKVPVTEPLNGLTGTNPRRGGRIGRRPAYLSIDLDLAPGHGPVDPVPVSAPAAAPLTPASSKHEPLGSRHHVRLD
jgi:hypothetical protein